MPANDMMDDVDEPAPENESVAEQNAAYLRALDLHDETGQILTAILVNLQRLGRNASAPAISETVKDTQHLVETLFYSIRRFIRSAQGTTTPRPGSIPGPNLGAGAATPPLLGPAIRNLTAEFSRRTGVEVDLQWEDAADRVPGSHRAVCYRVIQESLTNVFRHSAASRVVIRLARTGSSIVLEIEDDGLAHPGAVARMMRPGPPGPGSGLAGMRERVRIAGGECDVRMIENRGMSVRVVLPYNIA